MLNSTQPLGGQQFTRELLTRSNLVLKSLVMVASEDFLPVATASLKLFPLFDQSVSVQFHLAQVAFQLSVGIVPG